MLNNLLPNPMLPLDFQKPTLNLNQIENFEPVKSFTDETNITWELVKSASDSTKDVPDPKNVYFTDCWLHEFPGLKTKIYVYVVEGIKPPRIETEQPSRVLYQWFSSVKPLQFNPSMITQREWLKANVYAAPLVLGRVGKLKAICKITDNLEPEKKEEDKLIQIEEFNNGNS